MTGLPPLEAGGAIWIIVPALPAVNDTAAGGAGALSFLFFSGFTSDVGREGGLAPMAFAADTVKLTAWPFARSPTTAYPFASKSRAGTATFAPDEVETL